VNYLEKCPGKKSGKPYMTDEEAVTFLCKQHCLMVTENGVDKFQCNDINACKEHSTCGVRDGRLDCYCDKGYIGDGQIECRKPQQNCADLQAYFGVTASGVQQVWGHGNETMNVFCDMSTDKGGWVVIQRREDDLSFQRDWNAYMESFGSLASTGSFWLGLENIHLLTSASRSPMQLRIDLTDCDGVTTYEFYDDFMVDSAEEKYRLHVRNANGTAGDALVAGGMFAANEMLFSTRDQDNDKYPKSCSELYGGGGWWYNACTKANLNGAYYAGCSAGGKDAATWLGRQYRKIEMKLRPKIFPPQD